MNNLVYKSEELIRKYSVERNHWVDFYESERTIFERVLSKKNSFSILDVGCGCGGLAKALEEKEFRLRYYKGIDINRQMIDYAIRRRDIVTTHDFECKDIVELNGNDIYDVVISLSCIDWNNDVEGMLRKCWEKVVKGGCLISSFRLTEKESITSGAYQYIEDPAGERYNYVVFNTYDLIKRLMKLSPSPAVMECYGYWGIPSPTAIVDRDKLCFSVFAIHKSEYSENNNQVSIRLDLPKDVWGD